MQILFFDGYCSLCNGLVDALMYGQKNQRLMFASLQGETASRLLPPEKLQSVTPETVIYFRDGQLYERSTAILLVCKDRGGVWSLVSVLFLLPQSWRDFVYGLVARHRYRIFGRRETCRVPTLEERERLLP